MTEVTEEPTSEVRRYKVRVPAERFVRLRDAEPGMELARDITNENDQLLFPENTTLSRKDLRRLHNFGKRGIYVEDFREKWVTPDEYQSLPEAAEHLETRTIPTKESEEDPRDSNEQESTDSSRYEDTFDFISETESPRRLEEFVKNLRESVETADTELTESRFKTILDRSDDLKDIVQYLLAQIPKLEDEEAREAVLSQLYDMSFESREHEVRNKLSEDVLFDLEQFQEGKNKVKNELIELIHDEPELLEQLSASQIPDSSPSSPDRSEWQSPDQASLKDSLRDVAESSDDLNPEELKVIDDLLEAPHEHPHENLKACLMDTLTSMESGQWSKAVQGFQDCMNRAYEKDPPGNFKDYQERASELIETKENLAQRLNESLEAPEEYEDYSDVLELGGENLLDVLSDKSLPLELTSKLQSFLDDRQQIIFKFWDELREILPQLLDSLDESDRNEVMDVFRDITNQFVKSRDVRLDNNDETLYEPGSSGEGPESRRDEKLLDAVESRDFERIKRHNPFPDMVIDGVKSLYRKPEAMDKWQKKLINRSEFILHQLLFGLRVPREEIGQFLQQTRQVLDSKQKPYSLFVQPPSTEAYHLVHAHNTGLLSLMVGRKLGMPEKALKTLLMASLMADVGLTVIPDSFYLKSDELTRRAESEVRKHPIYSQKIVGHILGPNHTVTRLVDEHHERLDGSGYPQEKKQEDLSPLSLVLICADVYTAMIEERSYRSQRLPDEALEVLNDDVPRVSRKVVNAIEEVLGYYPNGSLVKLTDGTLAFVKKQTPSEPRKPLVYVLTDSERNRLDRPIKKDLSKAKTPEVSLLLRT